MTIFLCLKWNDTLQNHNEHGLKCILHFLRDHYSAVSVFDISITRLPVLPLSLFIYHILFHRHSLLIITLVGDVQLLSVTYRFILIMSLYPDQSNVFSSVCIIYTPHHLKRWTVNNFWCCQWSEVWINKCGLRCGIIMNIRYDWYQLCSCLFYTCRYNKYKLRTGFHADYIFGHIFPLCTILYLGACDGNQPSWKAKHILIYSSRCIRVPAPKWLV